MQIYLPIAELSINVFLVLGLGGMVGFLSGMFGVGGGFLMTPLLIFAGIPPPVAVATEANQIVGSSVSGSLAHWRRGNVDLRMGAILLAGGILGSLVGVQIFRVLREIGQINLVIALCYSVFLSVIGALMLFESGRAIWRRRSRKMPRRTGRRHNWVHGLPLKLRFRRSNLYISVIPPVFIGFFVGMLASLMGVGGGFFMIPAMIYLLRMPTSVVVGTSLFQILFVTAFVTFLHATQNQTVDIFLAMLLLASGVIGAQLGARMSIRIGAEYLRAGLALMVLAVCINMISGLVSEPAELFTLTPLIGGEGGS